MVRVRFFILVVVLMLSACRDTQKNTYRFNKVASSSEGMVVSAHPLATQAGIDILRKGGNAIDAAVAVQFALAVVHPRAGNIGGGGFMLSRNANGALHALDFREVAPAQASADMYINERGRLIEEASLFGHRAVAVPGTVDGLLKALDSLGSGMSLEEIMKPALFMAENGFRLTSAGADSLTAFQPYFKILHPKFSPFLKDIWLKGDVFIQQELKGSLQRIVDLGREGFYEGQTAQFIVQEMERIDGIITLEDLKNYSSKWRTPLHFEYDNYDIYSMPLPSSGGIALAQLSAIAESLDLGRFGFHDTRSIHAMAEAERRVFADRAKFLGDPDFVSVPLEDMLDSVYLRQRMQAFSWNTVTSSDSIDGGMWMPDESRETTHTCVTDADGNAVTITTTLNSNFGSKVYVTGAGFLLNNQMNDFSIKQGVPNQFGLLGNEQNAIAPRKRMLSSMAPTIVEEDGAFLMCLGTPGGGKIITAIFQVLMNVLEYGLPIDRAVQAPRFHHQWYPDVLYVEKGRFDQDTLTKLRALGHQVEETAYLGYVKAIYMLPDGTYIGVGDMRSEDHAGTLSDPELW